mgnify:CR=1 FL=1
MSPETALPLQPPSAYEANRDIVFMTLPLLALSTYFYGARPAVLCLTAAFTAMLCDHLVAWLRHRPCDKTENSSIPSALVLVLLLPATVHYYVVVVSVAVAILLGKHAFGGYGHYPFNPAAFGYAVAAVSWPGEVFLYPVPFTTMSVLDTSSLTASDVNNEADGSHEDLAEWLDPFTAGSPFAADSTRNWNAYDGIVELRFDADDYVVSVKPVAEKDVYSYYGNKYVAGEHGNSSITTADALATPGSHTGTMDSVKDARVYRIGGVREEAVLDGTHNTWSTDSHTADFHHYDSAPEVLTLKGRTLYVTTDQRDEGLALTSDAKAVVIQRENGKWKTREFNNVSSAIAQVADADRNSLNGKQFLGEVVAVMNDRAQATWLVITSYANLVSGGNVPSPGVGAVNNVAVQYIDVDRNGSSAGINGDEYTAFKLYNTTAGRKYTVTMYTSFGGVTTTRVKVVTGTAGTTLCNSQTDGFYGKLDAGTQITITCEEGVGTYVVPADGSLIGSCTL